MNASSRITVLAMVALMVLAAFVLTPAASSYTVVKGNITDTHWTLAMSPIYVENNITIGEGKSLVIDAGVQVLVNGSYTIYVNGTLTAHGNGASPVLFASNKTVKNPGDWKGIRFNATASALFENVNVSHAKTPIYLVNCTNVTFINSTFYKTQSLDVNVTGDGELTLVNTTCGSMNTTGGILHLADFLTMKAVFQFNNTPVRGVDVLITDNNYPIYTTPRYGGTDPLTNASGLVGPIVARYATYDHSNVSQMNITKIYTKYNHSSGIKNVKNESIIVSDATQVVLVYDITPPASPTNFTATVRSGTRIDLAWLGPADGDLNGFYVYQKFGMGYSLMQITKNHYYNFTSLDPKTRYDFSVLAVDHYDNPSTQVFANGTTYDTIAPAVPLNLTVSAVTGTTVALEWDANTESDLAGYYIYVNATVGWKPKITVDNATLAYTVTNLTSETTYAFAIEAFDDALPIPNNSTKSAVVEATTLDITAPETPNIILPPTAIISTLAIRGQILDKETLKIVIHNDRNGYHNTTNTTGGIINTTIPLEQGNNVVMIYAVDGAGNIGGNVTGTVYCDSLAPVAACQGDIAIFTGETAYFNATGSLDNLGIVNYVWNFIYGNASETVSGALANFTFLMPYHYLVTLTVGDVLGNEGSVTFWLNVTDKVIPVVDVTAPKITLKTPAENSYDIARDVMISVTFNEALDPLNWTIVLKQGSDIVSGEKNLTNGYKTLTFKPLSDLAYNTTYTINVTAVDPAGNKMYSEWTFVTVENPNQPVTPTDDDDNNDTKDDNFKLYATIAILAIIIILFLVVIIIVVRKAMTERDLITDETRAEESEDKIEYACPKCSAPLSEGITYCYECGAEFTEDEAKSAGEKVTEEDEEEEEEVESEEKEEAEGEEEEVGAGKDKEKEEADEDDVEEDGTKDEDSRDESHTDDEEEDSEDADDAESDEDSEDDVEEADEEEAEGEESENGEEEEK